MPGRVGYRARWAGQFEGDFAAACLRQSDLCVVICWVIRPIFDRAIDAVLNS